MLANYAYNVCIHYNEIENNKISEVEEIKDSKTTNYVVFDLNNDSYLDIITNNKIFINDKGEFNKFITYTDDYFDSSFVFVQPMKDTISKIIKIFKSNQNQFELQSLTINNDLQPIISKNLKLEYGFSNILNFDVDSDYIDEYLILPSDRILNNILILKDEKLLNFREIFTDNIFSKFEKYNEIVLIENNKEIIILKSDSINFIYNLKTKKIKNINKEFSNKDILKYYLDINGNISLVSSQEISSNVEVNEPIFNNLSLNNINISYLNKSDLNGDNLDDLFIVDNFMCSNYHIILNDKNGSIKVPSNLLDNINLSNFIFADINNDNVKEIIYYQDNIKILKVNYESILESDKSIKTDFTKFFELPETSNLSYINYDKSSYITNISNQDFIKKNFLLNNKFSLNVTPNPFLQKIKINLTNLNKSEVNISLFNTLGEKVIDIYKDIPENSELNLDYSFPIELLSSNIYVLLVTQNNQTVSKKIIRSF